MVRSLPGWHSCLSREALPPGLPQPLDGLFGDALGLGLDEDVVGVAAVDYHVVLKKNTA